MANHQDNFNMSELIKALNDEDRVGLMIVFKTEWQNLTRLHPFVAQQLSPNVRKRVDFLRCIQVKHDELENNYFEERAALDAKYQKLYEPLYAQRYEVVNGIVEVDEVENEPVLKQKDKEAEVEEKGVPDFWLMAMKNNDVVAEEITKRDEGVLKYLKDIKWCKVQEPKGFKLDFFFDKNPYFKNTVLTKVYHMVDEEEPTLEKATGTEIEWFPGKCIAQNYLKNVPTNEKPKSKPKECESFFNFFDPLPVPEKPEELDKDYSKAIQHEMEEDYDVGWTIRDKIIPHAVSWFTGEADEDEDDDDDDDDDDVDIDFDGDDYGFEEEDEEEDEEEVNKDDVDGGKPETKESGRAVAGEGEQGQRPADCEQQ